MLFLFFGGIPASIDYGVEFDLLSTRLQIAAGKFHPTHILASSENASPLNPVKYY